MTSKSPSSKFLNMKNKLLLLFPAFILIAIILYLNDPSSPKVSISQNISRSNKNEFSLSIPKIHVNAPVLIGVDPTDEKSYNSKLSEGVALMTGTAIPGTMGNTFIYGHSSSETDNKYSRIFEKLDELKKDDEVSLNYNDRVYRYVVESKKIIEKDDMSVLEQPKDKNILTLMTCWPIGSDEKRLIIQADLKSPK